MNRNVRLAPIGLAVALAITLAGCVGTSEPTHTVTSSSTPKPATTSAPVTMTDAQIAKSLNVPQGTTLYDFKWAYPKEFTNLVKAAGWPTEVVNGQTIPQFKSGSNDWKNKLFLDGVQPPLTTDNMNGVLLEILTRPDSGAQIAVGLSMTKYGGGSNPWVTSYFGGIDNVKSWATNVMSVDPAVRLVGAKELALVAYLVEHYTDTGVAVRDTVLNFRTTRANENGLAIDPTNPTTISDFLVNPDQYRGTFVVFKVKYKGMTGCTPEEWGVNTLDGRFALLKSDCVTPPPATVTPPPATVTPPPATVTPPKPSSHPTPTSCVKPVGGTKYWDAPLGKYICKGPGTGDPSYQGHNLPGGNGTAPGQTDKQGAPAGGAPTVTYTVPAAPAVTGPPAGSTPGGDTGGAVQGGGGVQ